MQLLLALLPFCLQEMAFNEYCLLKVRSLCLLTHCECQFKCKHAARLRNALQNITGHEQRAACNSNAAAGLLHAG